MAFLTGLCIIFVLAIGSYSKWFNEAVPAIPSPYRYGDLYLFSNNGNFRINTHSDIKLKKVKAQANLRLTLIGDSYIYETEKENFVSDSFDRLDWGKIPDTIANLTPNHKNILIIETTERYARWRLMMWDLVHFGKRTETTTVDEIKLSAEDNLQYLITNFDIFLPFKELKSSIYYNMFDRYDERVAKPNNSGRLYLNETIDEHLNSSSYAEIKDQEINELIRNINLVHERFIKMGYTQVYLSIIPNAASIYNYEGKKYNHLIERIQQHPNLKMPVIDAYKTLSKADVNIFHYSDSHWNVIGQQLWIDELNNALSNHNKAPITP